jgi:tetraacyldisaccharide 4'-kinase
MKASKFGAATINVGNLSMGGTGKSPHVEYLIRLLKDDFEVATLSRGFGRTERGFLIADENSTAKDIGDEPLQFYKKYGDQIKVSVEANRVLGAMDLFFKHPEVNVLLLDDAYQHRAIHRGMNILLTDYSKPFYSDFILPVGNLRESRRSKKRADIIVVTKCPELEDSKKNEVISKIGATAKQQVFFSSITYGQPVSFKADEELTSKFILVTGIANASPLITHLETQGELVHHFKYNDHHKFRSDELTEIHNLFDKFANEKLVIITTEKDAMRLISKEFSESLNKYPWFYQPIEVEIDDKIRFNQAVLEYVKENNRDH